MSCGAIMELQFDNKNKFAFTPTRGYREQDYTTSIGVWYHLYHGKTTDTSGRLKFQLQQNLLF